ncbi:MAG: hypothetical protein JW987_06225 [Anaerolineaceae bacterium]|nr:hypothetical protein [Anaerolineaceae bacterium]
MSTYRPSPRHLLLLAAALAGLYGLGLLSLQPPRSALAAGLQATDGYPPPYEITPIEGYPEPSDPYPTDSYPGPVAATSTPGPTNTSLPPGQPSPTIGLMTATASPTIQGSPSPSVTPGRDLYATENAEMGGALVTPPPLQTLTPTLATVEPAPTAVDEPDGFQLDSQFFLIGLLVPLGVILLGGILYKLLNTSEFR